MATKKNEARSSSPDLDAALIDFILEAPDDELVEVFHDMGLDTAGIAAKAQQAAEKAVALHRATPTQEGLNKVESLHKGLGILLQMLRRRDGISEESLAAKAQIDIEEIRRVEYDPAYTPKPRTVYQLENFFRLPERSLTILAGAAHKRDKELEEEVLRFAAHSKDLGKLSHDEHKLLRDFVRFLASKSDDRRSE